MNPWISTRYRVKPVCTGRGRQNRSARFAPCQTHVTRERYIKVFEPAVLAAMQKLQASLEELRSGH
jgi:hypothetical protein